MKQIKITRGRYALVDDEDYERLTKHQWALNPEGNGYAIRKGNKHKGEPRTIQMHREILELVKDKDRNKIIDHINGNGLDNRKCNLRVVTIQKNAFNKVKANGSYTSKYKGVLKRKNKNGWIARIKFNDRHMELGTYYDEELAAAVYNFASRLMFGDFRKENVSNSIFELSIELKIEIYNKCKRYIEKYNWQVNTEQFKSFVYVIKSISYKPLNMMGIA